MTARRLMFVLATGLSAGVIATAGGVAAQPAQPGTGPTTTTTTTTTKTTTTTTAPKKAAKAGKKAPVAPAKGATTGAAAGSGTTTGTTAAPAGATTGSAAGSAAPAEPAEPPPPRDMNGIDENPGAPKSVNNPDDRPPEVVVAPMKRSGYPIELAARPITLPKNLSEVSIDLHAQVSPYAGAGAIRARYGITSKIQLGLTYLAGGIYDDPATAESKQAFHPGKAVGLDVTYLLQDWIGVTVGVPLYINPLAVSLAIGAPIKFTLADKFAIGGLDDLLNIKLDNFAPSFYQEVQNATNANRDATNTIVSAGELRFSAYGIFQYQPDFAIIARIGVQLEDFSSTRADACGGECFTTFLHAGLLYTPRKYLDLGLQIGFDDLGHGGSFAPNGYLAFRI